jgi:hypothetical protein
MNGAVSLASWGHHQGKRENASAGATRAKQAEHASAAPRGMKGRSEGEAELRVYSFKARL